MWEIKVSIKSNSQLLMEGEFDLSTNKGRDKFDEFLCEFEAILEDNPTEYAETISFDITTESPLSKLAPHYWNEVEYLNELLSLSYAYSDFTHDMLVKAAGLVENNMIDVYDLYDVMDKMKRKLNRRG